MRLGRKHTDAGTGWESIWEADARKKREEREGTSPLPDWKGPVLAVAGSGLVWAGAHFGAAGIGGAALVILGGTAIGVVLARVLGPKADPEPATPAWDPNHVVTHEIVVRLPLELRDRLDVLAAAAQPAVAYRVLSDLGQLVGSAGDLVRARVWTDDWEVARASSLLDDAERREHAFAGDSYRGIARPTADVARFVVATLVVSVTDGRALDVARPTLGTLETIVPEEVERTTALRVTVWPAQAGRSVGAKEIAAAFPDGAAQSQP